MAATRVAQFGRTAGDTRRHLLIMITHVIILLGQGALPLLVAVVQIQ